MMAFNSGKKIAVNFEVGDQMYEPPKEQPVVVDQASPKLPPLEEKPPEQGHFERVGICMARGSERGDACRRMK